MSAFYREILTYKTVPGSTLVWKGCKEVLKEVRKRLRTICVKKDRAKHSRLGIVEKTSLSGGVNGLGRKREVSGGPSVRKKRRVTNSCKNGSIRRRGLSEKKRGESQAET